MEVSFPKSCSLIIAKSFTEMSESSSPSSSGSLSSTSSPPNTSPRRRVKEKSWSGPEVTTLSLDPTTSRPTRRLLRQTPLKARMQTDKKPSSNYPYRPPFPGPTCATMSRSRARPDKSWTMSTVGSSQVNSLLSWVSLVLVKRLCSISWQPESLWVSSLERSLSTVDPAIGRSSVKQAMSNSR